MTEQSYNKIFLKNSKDFQVEALLDANSTITNNAGSSLSGKSLPSTKEQFDLPCSWIINSGASDI